MQEDTKVYIATINRKGQVTIPIEVRQLLHFSPQGKVIFRIIDGTRVEIVPHPMTLEEAHGSVAPLSRPQDFSEIKQIAAEERAENWLKKNPL